MGRSFWTTLQFAKLPLILCCKEWVQNLSRFGQSNKSTLFSKAMNFSRVYTVDIYI